jgi:hypothetical protein
MFKGSFTQVWSINSYQTDTKSPLMPTRVSVGAEAHSFQELRSTSTWLATQAEPLEFLPTFHI